MRFSLIYEHMLDHCGYDNHFCFGKWKLEKDNLVAATELNFSNGIIQKHQFVKLV